MTEATFEEAKVLMTAGWVPDVPGGRTHWLHRELAPVLGVSTAIALARQEHAEARRAPRRPIDE